MQSRHGQMSNLICNVTFALILCLTLCSCVAAEVSHNKQTKASLLSEHLLGVKATPGSKLSISPFPYDLTTESLEHVAAIVDAASSVYTIQLDNGIPWQEAFDKTPFPPDFERDLRNRKNAVRPDQKIYLAIAPLQDDRTSWANAFDGKKAPTWVLKETQINDKISQAYISYVFRVIDYFNPDYINIGVEAGDAAHKDAKKWQSLAPLFVKTLNAIKSKHPTRQAGISWSLPLLMQGQTLNRSEVVISVSDYIGISFYPYMHQFYEKIGGVSLPSPPAQWREPLSWLRENTNKPIAICETGYSSSTVIDKQYGLHMEGSEEQQAKYVAELAEIATRDNYLFTMFFLAVDYDVLREKLHFPIMKLWEHIGFFDRHLQPKAAWQALTQHWLKQPQQTSVGNKGSKTTQSSHEINLIDKAYGHFNSYDEVSLKHQKGLVWRYTYKNDWSWALKTLSISVSETLSSLIIEAKSNRPGPILVQLKERSGEAFFIALDIQKDWSKRTTNLLKLAVDNNTRKNGVFEPEQLVSIMLADSAGAEQDAKGTRTIEVRKLSLSD